MGNSSWLVSHPATFGTGLFSYPSAICYYFGRSMYTHFNGTVPIGLVSASVGGSAIEFWSSANARADGTVKTGTCGGSTAKLANGCLESAATTSDSVSTNVAVGGWTPGCFFNAMIHPFEHMQLRGVLWDQ